MDPGKNPPNGAAAQAGSGPADDAAPGPPGSRLNPARRNALTRLAIGLALVAITVAAYWGIWRLEFVYFDDPGYVGKNNPFVHRGLTWENVGWAFTSFAQSNWHPLSWLSHMADCQFFHLPDTTPPAAEDDAAKPGPAGLEPQAKSYEPDPGKHHVVNLAFHLANTLLLFWLLWRMTGATWRSGLVAALFAIHPLHVESVAWVAERKDVLSTFLGLLTLHAYVSYAPRAMSARRTLWVGGLSIWVAIVWAAAYFLAIQPAVNHQDLAFGLKLGPTVWAAAILTLPVLAAYGFLSWRFFLVIAGLAVGLLAKPMLVTLPFMCLLLDYWPLRRIPAIRLWPQRRPEPRQSPARVFGPQAAARRLRRARGGNSPPSARTAAAGSPVGKQPPLWSTLGCLVLEKLPLFLLAVASSRVTYYAQQVGGAMADVRQLAIPDRLENASVAYMSYIGKMLVPRNMGCLYMLPPLHQDPGMATAAWLALVVITGGVLWVTWRGRRYVAVGWFWYLGTLVPVIGLVQVGDQRMADRYAYIPLVGLFLIAAWGAGELVGCWPDLRARLTSAVAVVSLALLAACAWVTHHQLQFWQDRKTVLEHAIAVDDRNCKAHNNLGVALWEWKDDEDKLARIAEADPERREEAEEHRRKAAEYRQEAREHWRIAESIQHNDPYTHANLGHVLFEASQSEQDPRKRAELLAEATQQVQLAIANRSILPEPHNTYGRIHWAQAGRLEQEAGVLAGQGKPDDARRKRAESRREMEGAAAEFREALTYDAGLMAAHENLAKLLMALQKWDEAQEEVREMLKTNPKYPGAWLCQATISTATGRPNEALAALAKAVSFDPNNLAAQDQMAMACWQQGKRAAAAPYLRVLLRLSPEPSVLAERFGTIFDQQKKPDEAARAWTFMAWSLATSPLNSVRNASKAIDLGRNAVDRSRGQSAAAMDALAAAYAAAGQFPDALRVAEQALVLARAGGDKLAPWPGFPGPARESQAATDAALVEAVQARIALYQQGRPFRDTWEDNP
ncbi:MAG: tetratricopeptide repeat protein [Thermoguttaceae bacterium]|jgi:tetratricopeptide (TPR) repeat protein